MNQLNWRLHLVVLVAVALFVVSLFLPAITCQHRAARVGLDVLSTGWAGLLMLDPRWYANPMALVLVYRLLFVKTAGFNPVLGVLILFCAILSPLPSMACGGGAGGPEASVGLEPGGFLWMVSMITIAICGLGKGRAPEEGVETLVVEEKS
ncbi:MAG: hypothetical protein V4633_08575 [Pseudomonadota bacterium]